MVAKLGSQGGEWANRCVVIHLLVAVFVVLGLGQVGYEMWSRSWLSGRMWAESSSAVVFWVAKR